MTQELSQKQLYQLNKYHQHKDNVEKKENHVPHTKLKENWFVWPWNKK